jgi:hypothetical protein
METCQSDSLCSSRQCITTAAKGIAEIITLAGYVNVDFQDVRAVMYNAGPAVMGTAETKGDNRARTLPAERCLLLCLIAATSWGQRKSCCLLCQDRKLNCKWMS